MTKSERENTVKQLPTYEQIDEYLNHSVELTRDDAVSITDIINKRTAEVRILLFIIFALRIHNKIGYKSFKKYVIGELNESYHAVRRQVMAAKVTAQYFGIRKIGKFSDSSMESLGILPEHVAKCTIKKIAKDKGKHPDELERKDISQKLIIQTVKSLMGSSYLPKERLKNLIPEDSGLIIDDSDLEIRDPSQDTWEEVTLNTEDRTFFRTPIDDVKAAPWHYYFQWSTEQMREYLRLEYPKFFNNELRGKYLSHGAYAYAMYHIIKLTSAGSKFPDQSLTLLKFRDIDVKREHLEGYDDDYLKCMLMSTETYSPHKEALLLESSINYELMTREETISRLLEKLSSDSCNGILLIDKNNLSEKEKHILDYKDATQKQMNSLFLGLSKTGSFSGKFNPATGIYEAYEDDEDPQIDIDEEMAEDALYIKEEKTLNYCDDIDADLDGEEDANLVANQNYNKNTYENSDKKIKKTANKEGLMKQRKRAMQVKNITFNLMNQAVKITTYEPAKKAILISLVNDLNESELNFALNYIQDVIRKNSI